MSVTDLTFERWRALDQEAAARHAREAARQVGGQLVHVDSAPHLDGVLHRALIERAGQRFALIPGGEVTVGFELDAWQPLAEQLDSYRTESLRGGYGFDPDPRAHLAQFLTARRTVTVPTLLIAVEPEELTELPDMVPAALAGRGLRLPSPDEWEHACGAGATTLFRWGDHCPLDNSPYGAGSGPRHQPNAFGLHIAYDVYRAEMTSDPASVYGGDGGEAVCGGYGAFVQWLPLATANRNPAMAEFLTGPDGADMCEEFSTRPVLELA
ncbi:hypothetical protein ABZ707_01770 [Streptomyces sp. NPDC006923]|uniref:hypothetical protein n=1 Tax=Streptomyces sp. NPDC006923 TaxID=3155355 RepID=UPI0033DF45F4